MLGVASAEVMFGSVSLGEMMGVRGDREEVRGRAGGSQHLGRRLRGRRKSEQTAENGSPEAGDECERGPWCHHKMMAGPAKRRPRASRCLWQCGPCSWRPGRERPWWKLGAETSQEGAQRRVRGEGWEAASLKDVRCEGEPTYGMTNRLHFKHFSLLICKMGQ